MAAGLLPLLEIFLIMMLALVFGSFASALIWRVPRGLPWALERRADGLPRSACPSCGKKLTFRDLVPLFSWLTLRGRCRHCQATIPLFYPLAELLTLAACLGVYFSWGLNPPALLLMLAMPFLVALLVIDCRHLILPNQLVGILAFLALCLLLWHGLDAGFDRDFAGHGLMVLGAGFVYGGIALLTGMVIGRVLGKEALGFGDVKFFVVAGLWLGLFYLPFFLICAGIAGVAWGLFYRFVYKKPLFPFGPALIVSLYISIILKGLNIVPFVVT